MLSDAQEHVVLGVMRTFSVANRTLSRVQTIEMVRDLFELPKIWVGQSWYRSFIKRHADLLHPVRTQLLAAKRTNAGLLPEVHAFLESMENFHEKHHFTAETTYAADETLLCIRMSGHTALRMECRQGEPQLCCA
jgi:hypothetical protein